MRGGADASVLYAQAFRGRCTIRQQQAARAVGDAAKQLGRWRPGAGAVGKRVAFPEPSAHAALPGAAES
ncbi:hypothetical protein G6F21_014737 [Rhizopus arrhizus]|nr:hypothetical protein G6F21_014737 [Rhizopus arrhizus]